MAFQPLEDAPAQRGFQPLDGNAKPAPAKKSSPSADVMRGIVQSVVDSLSPASAMQRFGNTVQGITENLTGPAPKAAPAKPVTAGGDVAASGVSGLASGVAGLVDSMNPLPTIVNAIGRRVGVDPQLRTATASTPTYTPQTTAGRYTKSVASMAPNAVTGGGGIASRVAQVVLPGVAAEGAADLTKALGGGQKAQDAARLVGAVGGGVASGVRRVPVPSSTLSPDVLKLVQSGVQLTPGQANGGLAKAFEDAATSTPILGTAVQDARRAGLESYNTAVANDALGHVGASVPGDIAAGHDTVSHVQQALSSRYNSLIPDGGVTLDAPFGQTVSDIRQNVATMTPKGQDQLQNIVSQRLMSRLAGGQTMDGPTFQRVQGELKSEAARFQASPDPDHRAISGALTQLSGGLDDAAARQNPAFAASKSALDSAYAKFTRLQTAAASQGAENGVFTPAQYSGAVRAGDRSLRKGRFATGNALGQDLSQSGRAVLPSKVPDSGTATRTMIGSLVTAPGSVIGGFMGGGPVAGLAAMGGIGATIAGLKLGAKAYSPEALTKFNSSLASRASRQSTQNTLKSLQTIFPSAANSDAGLYPRLSAGSAFLAATPAMATSDDQ